MRPVRFILLLTCFVALPVFLTCWSLFSSNESPGDTFRAGYNPQPSRFRALFSFSTPSSLFPPSAVISLTNDNSTFFLARPAAFGPSLPSKGLSGQLWVGRGFGDETVFEEDGLHITGWELGCSDVPGWREDERKRLEKLAAFEKPQKRSIENMRPDAEAGSSDNSLDTGVETPSDDGTDDYLHHPLPDSNPAKPGKLGEPANVDSDKTKKPTHADIESLQESADIAGKVVLLARGGCGFLEKVKWVQRRGGIALIVGDREKGASLTIMYAKGDTSNVTIPAIFTSYNAAHLLTSLVPYKGIRVEGGTATGKVGGDPKKDKAPGQADKPVFTTTSSTAKATNSPHRQGSDAKDDPSWMHDALAAIGLTDNSPWHQEDSRRPPGSGNIEWVLVEDWDEDAQAKADAKTQSRSTSKLSTSTTSSGGRTPTSRRSDDFVIGVQDWRDTELIAPKSTNTVPQNAGNNGKLPESASSAKVPRPTETALKGGSITPGSGEYDHQKQDQSGQPKDKSSSENNKQPGKGAKDSKDQSASSGFFSFLNKHDEARPQPAKSESKNPSKHPPTKESEDADQDGLWVTLTPTSVSTSPFFDTLLVLVVSPLVTLTFVYALLLLRSRIRRRRWRAPKSVVERLPVRTYHTMSTSSSTTSSQVSTPDHSSATSPLLHPTTQDPNCRTRPRSQTASGAIEGSLLSSSQSVRSLSRSPQPEKPNASTKSNKRKRYTGRQVECVVCLEDYVDGESRVMSLPCGHEFHADCITPWLVNRRRTCPICKGDVVRSLARAGQGAGSDQRQEGEQTSDDVQSRAAQTVNEEPSAAIPIPSRVEDSDDEDIERGQDVDEPLLGPTAERQSAWRNVIARSLSRLSGDTVWRQTPADRSR